MSRARTWRRIPLVVGAAWLASGAPARAQTLHDRVARIGTGTAALTFATRPGVCGDGAGMIGELDRRASRRWVSGSGGSGSHWQEGCEPGPARLTLGVVDGRVARVRLAVGTPRRAAAADVTDLGPVSAPVAAAYLLDLAERSDGPAGREAIVAAAFADSAVVWPRLLRLARSTARPSATRREAAFWVADAAGRAVAPGDADAADASDDREVREQAVFALSQRPRAESVPALIRIARTHRDAEIRRTSIFWLGQSGDARALDLFESVLSDR